MKKEGIVIVYLFCLIEVTIISATDLGFNKASISPNLKDKIHDSFMMTIFFFKLEHHVLENKTIGMLSRE